MPESAAQSLGTQPLSYADVLNLYRKIGDNPLFEGRNMPQFSEYLNKLSGSELFSAGKMDSRLARAVTDVESGVKATGVPHLLGKAFGGASAAIGGEKLRPLGTKLGEDLPMMAGEGLATAFGIAASGTGLGAAFGVPLALAGLTSTYQRTKLATGSGTAGAIAAGLNVAMPGVAAASRKFIAEPVLGAMAKGTLGEMFKRGAVHLGAEAVGTSAAQELASLATATALGESYNPFSTENLFQQIGGQLVFAPFNIWGARQHVLKEKAAYIKQLEKQNNTTALVKWQPQEGELGPIREVLNQRPVRKRGLALPMGDAGAITVEAEPINRGLLLDFPRESTLFGIPLGSEGKGGVMAGRRPIQTGEGLGSGGDAGMLVRGQRPPRAPQGGSVPLGDVKTVVSGKTPEAPKKVEVSEKPVDPQQVADQSGWTFDGEQVQGMTLKSFQDLPVDLQGQLQKTWTFTDRKGSGNTIYVPIGSAKSFILQRMRDSVNPPGTTPTETVQKATAVVTEGVAKKGAEGLKTASETVNEVSQKLNEAPAVSDATLAAKVEKHVDGGLPEREAVARVAQSVENATNIKGAKLQEREMSEARAMAFVSQLPKEVANFIGKAIKAVYEDWETSFGPDRLDDIKASRLYSAVATWYNTIGKTMLTPEALTAMTEMDLVQNLRMEPETKKTLDAKIARTGQLDSQRSKQGYKQREAAAKSLLTYVTGAGRLQVAKYFERMEKRGVEFVPHEPEVTPEPVMHGNVEVDMPETPAGVNETTRSVVEDEKQRQVDQVLDAVGEVLGEKPVTKDELIAAGIDEEKLKSKDYVARINAVLRDIAFGSHSNKDKNKVKGFAYTPSEETLKLFNASNEKSIQNFVRQNLREIGKALRVRMKSKGVDTWFMADESGYAADFHAAQLRAPFTRSTKTEPGYFAHKVKEFFHRYFLADGMTPDEAIMFADAAEWMSVAFKQIDGADFGAIVAAPGMPRAAKELLSRLKGVYQPKSPRSGAGTVGLNFFMSTLNKTVGAFAKLMVLGHETFHRVWVQTTNVDSPMYDHGRAQKLLRLQDALAKATPDTRAGIIAALAHLAIPNEIRRNPELTSYVNSMIKNSGKSADEFLANYVTLISTSVGHAKQRIQRMRRELAFSDPEYSMFALALYQDMRALVEPIVEVAKLAGVDGEEAAMFVREIHNNLAEMMRTQQEIDVALTELRKVKFPSMFPDDVDARGPPTVEDIISHAPMIYTQEGADMFDLDSETRASLDFFSRPGDRKALNPKLGEHPNWFRRNVMIPAHLREQYPMLQHVMDLVFGFRGHANKLITQAMAPFGRLTAGGRVVFDKDAPLIQVRSNPVLEQAASEALLEENFQKKRLSRAELETLTYFSKLTPEQKNVVNTALDQSHQSMGLVADLIAKYQMTTLGDTLAAIALKKSPLLRGPDAIAVGEKAANAFTKMGSTDPLVVAEGQQMLAEVQARVTPEAFAQMQTTFVPLKQLFDRMDSRIKGQKEYYTPETRLGKFYLRWKDANGKRNFIGVEDVHEARKRHDSLASTEGVTELELYEKSTQMKESNLLISDAVRAFSEKEKAAYDAAINAIRAEDPETANLMERMYTPGEAVYREVTARGFGKHFLHRRLVPGREEINMMQGIVAYVEGMGMGTAKALTKRRAALLLSDPDLQKNKELRNLARDYVTTVVDPPTKEWSWMKAAAFHYFLGGNPSSLAVEFMQPLSSLAPELTRRGAGIAEGYHLIGEAEFEAARFATKGKTKYNPEWKVEDAVRRAIEEQKLDFGVLQEMEGLESDATIINLRRASFGAAPLSIGQIVSKPLYMYGHLTRAAYRSATSHNARVSFISGYVNAIRRGRNLEQAYSEAVHVTESTMFGGGAASRPVGLFAKAGKFHGAVGALYTLRHYSVSMMSDWYRMTSDAINNSLKPEDRAGARKALGQMFVTQLALSGAMGLPMAGATVSLLEQLFPNLTLKADIREGLASLFGDDEELGGMWTDLAMKGVSSLGPVDLSARFGLGDMFGIDPNKGLSLATVAGAPGSMFERWYKGAAEATTGNLYEAGRELLPNSLSNLLKQYADDWDVRDKQGNLVYDPTEVETTLSAIGFKPKRLSHHREQQALMERQDEITRREIRQFHDSVATLLEKGQPQMVREALIERANEDGSYDVRAGLRQVVEIAQRRLLPADLGAKGTRGAVKEKESVAAAYPQAMAMPSAVERLYQRKQMEQSVGIPGAGRLAPQELRHAQVIDYLMQMNPKLSSQHAAMMAQELLGERTTPRIGTTSDLEAAVQGNY